MTAYNIGVVVRVSWVITNSAGAAVDPGAMTFKYKDDFEDTATTLTMGVDAALVKDSVGHYHVDLTTTKAGAIWYRVDATAANVVAAQSYLDVGASYF
jgi:hypothetical protein